MTRSLAQSIVVATCALLLTSCTGKQPDVDNLASQNKAVNMSGSLAEGLHMKTEPAERRLLSTYLHVTGQIHPEFGKEVSLTTRVTGRVVDIFVTPGQHIAAGQILALIDSQQISDHESELIEAHSALDIAKANEERERQIYAEQLKRPKPLIEAKAQYDQAKVQFELSEKELKRLKELYTEHIAAAKDYYAAQASHAKAQSIFHQATIDLEREEGLFQNKSMLKRDYQLAQAQTRRAQQHLNTLRQRLIFLGMLPAMVDQVVSSGKISGTIPIVSSLPGLVAHQSVALGQIVDPGKEAFKITDLTIVAISADVPEVDLSRVTMGMQVRARVTGYPNTTFTGTVSYVGSHVDPESRTVPIRARLVNPDMKLKGNMFAEIDIIEESPHLVLACPKSAVIERDDHKVVYVANTQGFQERRVSIGRSDEKYYEITSGLSEGERVVTSGSLLLKTELAGAH